jgi:hypothetical protein
MLKPAALAAAVAVLLAVAASPALAKPVAYSGITTGGNQITFKRTGSSVQGLSTMVPTTCVPAGSGAAPRAGAELYEPPARLPLGREVSLSALQEPTMHYSEVTKNYRFTARKRRNGAITGRLHVNFSYQTIGYSWQIVLVGYVCQGDATFKARPLRRG